MKIFASAVLTALSVVCLFPQPARAETIGVVAVAEPPNPSAELSELTLQLRSAVAERAQGVLEASQLRERMTGQTSSATLAELDRAYAGALATYQSGDFEGSVRTLRAVIDDLEKLPDSTEAFEQWTRAMMRLARSEQTLGRKDEAHAILERLVRGAPGIKVDPTQYPPSFAKQIEEAKAQLKSLPTRRLTIQTGAKGAKVFVEGREVGTAPLTLALPAGRYRVSGQLGNLRVPRVSVDLSDENQTVTLNLALAEALRPSTGPGLALSESDRSRNLVTAGGFLGLDKLIAASFATQGDVNYLVGTFYDVRRGMLLREGRVRLANRLAPPGSLTALASFLITGQPSSLVAATTMQPAPAGSEAAPVAKSSLPVGRETGPLSGRTAPEKPSKALGWTAFGAGVLTVGLGAFAVVEGLSAGSKYSDARKMLQGNTLQPGADPARYNQLVSDGDSARKMAFIGAGSAVAVAAVSGILGYLSYKQTGEVGPFRF